MDLFLSFNFKKMLQHISEKTTTLIVPKLWRTISFMVRNPSSEITNTFQNHMSAFLKAMIRIDDVTIATKKTNNSLFLLGKNKQYNDIPKTNAMYCCLKRSAPPHNNAPIKIEVIDELLAINPHIHKPK